MADQLPRRLKNLAQAAEAAGWTVDFTSKGHPRFNPPRGQLDPTTGRLQASLTFAKTPSDRAADRNGIAALRRAGVKIPRK